MGLRHVVLFRWNDEATPRAVAAMCEALATLPAQIPELVDYRFGSDAGLAEDNWDFAVVADFADQAGYEAYCDHPAHHVVIAERIRPLVAQRAAVQMLLDD